MTAAWPLSYPMISPNGYKESSPEGSIRTTVESGPAKMRRRFTKVPHYIEGIIEVLASADVDTLNTFYETTLAMGSLPFTWQHPRTAAATTFRFVKRPVITQTGDSPINSTATLSLEIISQP